MTRAEPRAGQRLALTLDDTPDALVRVLMTLHRRRCRVVRAEFVATGAPAGLLVIETVAPPAREHCVVPWLANLVDVRSVVSLD